jgi:hypothetical protein
MIQGGVEPGTLIARELVFLFFLGRHCGRALVFVLSLCLNVHVPERFLLSVQGEDMWGSLDIARHRQLFPEQVATGDGVVVLIVII